MTTVILSEAKDPRIRLVSGQPAIQRLLWSLRIGGCNIFGAWCVSSPNGL